MKNEGKLDRLLRAVLGLIFLYVAYFVTTDSWSVLFYILGVIMIFTAITGFCALYKLFRITTLKK